MAALPGADSIDAGFGQTLHPKTVRLATSEVSSSVVVKKNATEGARVKVTQGFSNLVVL
jgi:hypothetical protein